MEPRRYRPPPSFKRHNSFHLALLRGIWEGRCSNQVAGVGTLITGDKTFADTGVHSTDSGGGLVCKAVEIFLEEAFLEAFTRVPGHDLIAQLRRKLIEPSSEHIETDTRIEQSYFVAHVLRDAGSGVQSTMASQAVCTCSSGT